MLRLLSCVQPVWTRGSASVVTVVGADVSLDGQQLPSGVSTSGPWEVEVGERTYVRLPAIGVEVEAKSHSRSYGPFLNLRVTVPGQESSVPAVCSPSPPPLLLHSICSSGQGEVLGCLGSEGYLFDDATVQTLPAQTAHCCCLIVMAD